MLEKKETGRGDDPSALKEKRKRGGEQRKNGKTSLRL